jgi:hypothetical protein
LNYHRSFTEDKKSGIHPSKRAVEDRKKGNLRKVGKSKEQAEDDDGKYKARKKSSLEQRP